MYKFCTKLLFIDILILVDSKESIYKYKYMLTYKSILIHINYLKYVYEHCIGYYETAS